MADKVKFLEISEIIVGDRFRKDLGDIAGLTESIKEKGVLQPVTVNAKMELMAGGRRIAAAIQAGLSKIPALIREDEAATELDLREVELIENTFRKDFTWVEQSNLIAELDRLCKDKNTDWSLRKTAKLLGHSHPMNVSRALQLADAMQDIPELAECKTQDDALKTLKKFEEKLVVAELRRRQEQEAPSGLSETIALAKCNYQIGDALENMERLAGNIAGADFIEVDPPYGIELNDNKKMGGEKADTYKEVPTAEYADFLERLAKTTYKIADSNAWMVFWFGPTHHTLVISKLREAGWHVDDIPGIWNKGHGQTMQPSRYLARAYEPFFICRKGSPALVKQGRSNVFDFAPVPPAKKYHPTERPVALIEALLEVFCNIGSRVLIPFLGSGASLRACYNFGTSSAWGYDLNPEYRDRFLLAVEQDVKDLDSEEDS